MHTNSTQRPACSTAPSPSSVRAHLLQPSRTGSQPASATPGVSRKRNWPCRMTVAGTTVPSAASAVPAAVGKEQEEESVALFQQNWTTYQKLLHVDFLEHKLLYGQLQDVLLHLFGSSSGSGSQGVAMLDMACGDAMQIARTLRRCGSPAGSLPLASYTGVDLSAPALALAAQHLAFLQPSASVHLIEQDMDAYVQACPAGQYDLAFASFAVHHLRCTRWPAVRPRFCQLCGAPSQVGLLCCLNNMIHSLPSTDTCGP